MDIQALSAWGELIGGVAVVASLVFVGVQVRNGTEASRAATRQAILDSMLTVGIVSIDAATVGAAQIKLGGGAALDELTELEQYQQRIYWYMYARLIDNGFYQYRRRLLEPAEWRGFRSGLINNLRTHAGRCYLKPNLELMTSWVSAEFAEEIASVLREASAGDSEGT